VSAAAASPAAGPVAHRGLITGSIMLSTIMQALDTTIANVALPHMQGSLSATQDQISWKVLFAMSEQASAIRNFCDRQESGLRLANRLTRQVARAAGNVGCERCVSAI
jgi:hypothetical protein